jgi:rare lipoprotein A
VLLLLLVLLGSACGQRPVPSDTPSLARYTERGLASWYGKKYHGRLTASGERFDMHRPSAAHKTLPFGVAVRVTNLDNGRRIVVRINDRGPFVKGRIIDLSKAAAKKLGMIESGVVPVKIEVVDVGPR